MSQLLDALRQIEKRRGPRVEPGAWKAQNTPFATPSRPVIAPEPPPAAAIAAEITASEITAAEIAAAEVHEEPIAARQPVEVTLDGDGQTDYGALGDVILARAPDARSLLLAHAGRKRSPHFSAVTLAATLAKAAAGQVLLVSGPRLSGSIAQLDRLACSTTIPGLDLWTDASLPPEQNASFDVDLWGQLRERYRYVLLDAGSYQAGLRAAAACDACLLVIELGTTTRVQAERAIARLEAAGARLLGSVVVGGG